MSRLMVLVMAVVSSSAFAARIPVSVTQFTNESAYVNNPEQGCYYYWYWDRARLGNALTERLVARLVKDKRLQVLERQTINKIYTAEHQLINSQNTKQLEKGKFKQAKYTFVGVVKSFEFCSGGGGAKVNVGSLLGIGNLGVAAKKNHATVEVEVRLVNTRTGEVLASESGSAERTSMKLGLDGNIKRVDFSGSTFKNSLLGRAIDEAIHQAAEAILGEIPSES